MIDRIISIPKNHTFFLFGPRQTGKSTLLKALFPGKSTLYIDLLTSEDYLRYSSHPQQFRRDIDFQKSKITHVIVDEIQRIPLLLNDIHSIIESHASPYFCISGSSARKLKRSHANLLAGRAWTYNLYPLTHLELGNAFNLEKALAWGTLPSVYLSEIENDARRTLYAYVDTYLTEEVFAESLVRNTGAFNRFLPIAAYLNGQIINYSNISSQTGVSYNTVKEYFSILEDTLIGFFLYPFISSTLKKLTKHPKFYFFDTGVAQTIKGTPVGAVPRHTENFGRLFEQFIILEIIRLCAYREMRYSFSFYRTSADSEIDLIIESPMGKLFAIEIKSSESPRPMHLRSLLSFKQVKPDAHLLCVCLTPRPYRSGQIEIVPWQDIFEIIGL